MIPRGKLSRSCAGAIGVVLLLVSWTSGRVRADDAAGGDGKGHGVEVLPVTGSESLVEPGRILSVSFRVANRTGEQVEVEESWELPDGWDLVVPAGRMVLEPGETRVQLAAVGIPHGAAAGTYELTYRVTDLNDPTIHDFESFQVQVKRVTGLRLELVEPPAMVVAGETVTAQVVLINEGNAPLRARLSAESRVGYACEIEPRSVDLSPYGRETLTVQVSTDSTTRRPDRQIVTLVAEEAGLGKGVSARLALPVETVPRADVRPSLFETIPTTVTARGFVDNGTPGYQLEWRGSGTFGEHHEREVDFLFKGPAPNLDTTLLGVRDEYRLTYRSPLVDVMVGDQSYRLSRLTEQSQYGRGGGVNFHPGPVTAGIFYAEPRWGMVDPYQLGAWSGVKLGKWMELKLNALSQGDSFESTVTSFDQGVASVDGTLYPVENNRIEFEYAASGNLGKGAFDASAHRIEAFGTYGDRLAYNASLIHAEPGFTGYFKDMNYFLANVTYDYKDRYRLWGYAQSTRRNLDLDPDKGPSMAEKRVQLEARCINQQGWCVGGGYQFLSSVDRATPSTRDSLQNRLTARALRAGRDWTVDARAAIGFRTDRLEQETGFVQEYQAIARYQFRSERSVALSGRLAHDTLEDRPLRDATRSLGLQVNWAFSDTFGVDAVFLRAAGVTGSSQADLRLRYQWPRVATLALRGTYSGVDNSSTARYAVLLEVSRDLGVPVARKKSAGAVRGRVYDLEAPGKPGIEGVVVRMAGAVAITDRSGRFTLHAVSPGTHLLTVDSHTLGLDRILENGSEGIQVTVEAGRVARVALGVQRGATFTGSVRLYPDPEAAGTTATVQSLDDLYVLGDGVPEKVDADGRPLPSIAVRLRNDDGDVVERYTDERGVFVFRGLKPGLWRVEVLEYNLPPQHYVENPVLSVGLEAGKTVEVQFKVFPRKRKIHMLESAGGKLKLEARR